MIIEGVYQMAIRIERDITTTYLQSAMERAAANRKEGRIPVRQADGTYTVASATSTKLYTVRIINLTQLAASCNCAHGTGEGRGTCWHVVASLAEEVRRLGGKYTVRPRKTAPAAASVEWIKKGFVR